MDMTIRRGKKYKEQFRYYSRQIGKRIDCFGIYDLDVSLIVENCEGK